jgi:hypothetical protein
MSKKRKQSGPDEDEPATEQISGRSFEGVSFAATEREQTDDLRRRNPRGDADVADGGVSEELEGDSDSPPD